MHRPIELSEAPMSASQGSAVLAEPSLGSPCVACRLVLPIRPRPAHEEGQAWVCTRCDTKHHGVLIDNAPAAIKGNVRSAEASLFCSLAPTVAYTPKGRSKKPLPSREAVVCDHENLASRALDDAISHGARLSIKPDGPAFAKSVARHGATTYSPEIEEAFIEHYDDSMTQVETLVKTLEQGRGLDVEAPATVTREALARAAQDMDLFVRLGVNPPANDRSGKHSYHVAMLATSVGAALGWDEKTLVEIGIGCLLHDVGMSRVPAQSYRTDRVVDAGDFAEIVRHPLHTFDLLSDHYLSVPLVSRMVAYQVHERINGSGYPRQRQGTAIHQAAKVAAVADVYVALVSDRPHRPALMPYYAIEHLLYGVKSGEFDSAAVRALLKTVSLFPIGSFVALRDGRVARVIRANAANYGRPVVEAWQRDLLDRPPVVLDLALEPHVEIAGPLPRLEPV